MSRLIDHYYEWDILGVDGALLKERYQKLLVGWEGCARQALAAYPDILANLPVGTGQHWPDDVALARFAAHEKALMETSEALRTNYDPTLQELVIVGERALRQGIQSTGREQEDEFADALRLLKGVLESPIGSRNYVAWFQVAWLQWRAGMLPESTESFYQAVRLSASAAEPAAKRYQVLSLLHLAHLYARQERYDESNQCLDRAELHAPNTPDVLVERARLVVLQGNPSRAPEFLRPAMMSDISLLYGYFADEDFSTHIPVVLTRLIQDNATNNRQESDQEISRYHGIYNAITEVHQRLDLASVADEFAPSFLTLPEMQGFFGSATLRQQASIKSDAMQAITQKLCKIEVTKANEFIDKLQKQIKRFDDDKTHWLREKERAELTAREGGFTLDSYSFKNPLFPRKNQFIEQIRQMHTSSISHLQQAEDQIRVMKPDLEAKLDVQTTRIQKIEEALAWLRLEVEKNS
jgi:tetratricopeptide (TPR) repeat protein